MLKSLHNPLSRWFLACTMLVAAAGLSTEGFAQQPPGQVAPSQAPPAAAPPQAGTPPGATGNPICQRLEVQLGTIDRGTGSGDPAKDEQIRRYQDLQARQQGELDRVTSQAKKMGCESSGFFSLFNQNSAQCGPVNNQIQQMRANLDQITTSLERLRSGGLGGADRENQRRSVITALAQNNCGPQYAAAAREQNQGGGFLGGIFGNNNNNTPRRCRQAISVGPAAPSVPSACAPATARIFRSHLQPRRSALSTTRRPARRCARQRKQISTPIEIPARTWARRCR